MKILAKYGEEGIANVYVAEISSGKKVEFVESTNPKLGYKNKCVIIISTLFGCPIRCKFCDAGGSYDGKLSKNDLLDQIDFVIKNRFPNLNPNSCKKLKIQFARMGEPAFNMNVLEVLKELPERYNIKIIPSISTVAPNNMDKFFEELIELKKKYFPNNFQMQFSIHSTDEEYRNWLIPVKKWPFEKIVEYVEQFYDKDGKKITLNFAITEKTPIDVNIIKNIFPKNKCLIKITPVNPTHSAKKYDINSTNKDEKFYDKIVKDFEKIGFETILSIGENEENNIGSNCGQYLSNYISHN
ncbi:radical SAM protein [Pseudomonadota bacterium]